MRGIPTASLVIGIASSPDERKQLAQLLAGTAAFLIVSSVDQAREFLGVPGAPRVTAPAVEPAVPEAVADVGTPPGLSVDSDRRVLRWSDREIELTPLEHDFLRCLVGTPGQVWTYERLHLQVWGNRHLGRGSDMHSVVRRVRHKLARLDAAATIHAVRGVGFRLATA
ncbi:winged helix-turn-helix domain-containing protein [Micromonospora narathiwatensis]|uniref:Transcriptional regulatory protein, C terminal n=1 Tax=Micromonospora narathiwatensis TaxID=299146 RepID=A0A1A8ZLJ4_9ACTN|nr:winged helix-turn-helix domain-containing protein [Micromonospora narathiwatensis]SBT44687.1 Transcriptional regulatory protein, C terminal [Micromonospora narathiwatensis]